MDSYKLKVAETAQAELLALPFPFRRQLHQRILALREDPHPADTQQIGSLSAFSLEAHGFILKYSVDDAARKILIIAIRRT